MSRMTREGAEHDRTSGDTVAAVPEDRSVPRQPLSRRSRNIILVCAAVLLGQNTYRIVDDPHGPWWLAALGIALPVVMLALAFGFRRHEAAGVTARRIIVVALAALAVFGWFWYVDHTPMWTSAVTLLAASLVYWIVTRRKNRRREESTDGEHLP